MTVAYSGDKGEPELVPSGQPPTFAADVTEISAWFQKGRSFRRVSTQAALIAATGMEDNDLAVVDNIDGATFKYDGSAAAWRMFGVADFASSSARNTAITTPALGMQARSLDTDVIYRYNGAAWKPWESDWIAYTTTLGAASGTFAVGSGGSALNQTLYRYEQGRVRVRFRFVLGSSGASMGNAPTFTLPVAGDFANAYQILSAQGSLFNSSTTAYRALWLNRDNTQTARVQIVYLDISTTPGGINNPTVTTPWTWAAGHALAGELVYDPA